jgi:hypothetical protein
MFYESENKATNLGSPVEVQLFADEADMLDVCVESVFAKWLCGCFLFLYREYKRLYTVYLVHDVSIARALSSFKEFHQWSATMAGGRPNSHSSAPLQEAPKLIRSHLP